MFLFNSFQAPHLNWKEVVSELDHPGFMILSKQGFRLLNIQALFRGLQDIFPVEFIYRPWKNRASDCLIYRLSSTFFWDGILKGLKMRVDAMSNILKSWRYS